LGGPAFSSAAIVGLMNETDRIGSFASLIWCRASAVRRALANATALENTLRSRRVHAFFIFIC